MGQEFNLGTQSPFSLSTFLKSPGGEKSPSTRVPSRGFAVPSSSPVGPPTGEQPSKEKEHNVPVGGFNVEDILDFDNEPRSAKRSRNGNHVAQSMRSSRIPSTHIKRDPLMPEIVDGLVAGMAYPTSLQEDADTILRTESILGKLASLTATVSHDEIDQRLCQTVEDLLEVWSRDAPTESLPASIGPLNRSGFSKASYVAALLLRIHHPSSAGPSGFSQKLTSRALAALSLKATPIPRALLDWLDRYHNPFPEDLLDVQRAKPSPAAHDRFWDTVYQLLLRGQLTGVMELLTKANWSHAYTALDDGYDAPGYTGSQLSAVQHVMRQCVDLLRSCPGVTDDDWTITGPDWTLFRSRAQRALDDLEEFAESTNASRANEHANIFSADTGSFVASSRRAESRVPWTIYENLKAIYGELLGSKAEILLSAQDWLEASIYISVWWDGEDEAPLAIGRRGFAGRQRERLVDIDPVEAYQRKLLDSFAAVTDDPEEAVLGVNTVDPVQVALGAVFEGEVESVLKILARWSPLVASAVADVAAAGGWSPLDRARPDTVMDGLSQEDLMVLSHGQLNQKKAFDRDAILTHLSELLAKEERLDSSGRQNHREGWELAVSVLSRLDSATTAQAKISELFEGLEFTTADQVDKALSVCKDLGLEKQSRSISVQYADMLASTTHSYGEALLFYAKAHSGDKLQQTLDMLLNQSLVRSAAYPAHQDLDPKLADLLTKQAGILNELYHRDRTAARLLSDKSSGYATLRRFYELRDECDEKSAYEREVSGFKSGIKPAARKKEMVKGLVALIESAGESIQGGLYDANAGGVVPVDALLPLLAEALPLLQDSPHLFSKAQLVSILRAIEDLQSVSSRIFEKTNLVFEAAMSELYTGKAIEPQDLAKSLRMGQSNPDLAASSYGMVNSRGSIESERLANSDNVELGGRAWDWRRALSMTLGKTGNGADILRILRIAVAQCFGRGWAEGR